MTTLPALQILIDAGRSLEATARQDHADGFFAPPRPDQPGYDSYMAGWRAADADASGPEFADERDAHRVGGAR